jgi:TetR/AcrR family transcriptional repressor of nem operon
LLSHSAEILSAGPSAREAIEAWFTSLLPFYSGSDGEKGCLSVNTLTDGALDDAALQRSVALFNSRLEDLILSRLKRDRGQFSDDFDPAAVARTVMAVYFGLMVMAKQTPSQKKVKSVIEQVRKMLT